VSNIKLDPAERDRIVEALWPVSGQPGVSTVDAGAGNSSEFHCSFCGRPRSDVRKLIPGPRVFICDSCVAVCVSTKSGQQGHPARDAIPVPFSPGQPNLNCSFCGTALKPARVAFVCDHPGQAESSICARCLGICLDILADDLRGEWTDRQRSWPEASHDPSRR
jgi:hypothetical protein